MLSASLAAALALGMAIDPKLDIDLNKQPSSSFTVVEQAKKAELPKEVFIINTKAALQAQMATEKQVECMTRNLYFEARNQGQKGMHAVANVTMNRVKSGTWESTVCDVVYSKWDKDYKRKVCQFSWVCQLPLSKQKPSPRNQGDMKALQIARQIASKAVLGTLDDIVKGATHYHADYVSPKWAQRFGLLVVIGSHRFFK